MVSKLNSLSHLPCPHKRGCLIYLHFLHARYPITWSQIKHSCLPSSSSQSSVDDQALGNATVKIVESIFCYIITVTGIQRCGSPGAAAC